MLPLLLKRPDLRCTAKAKHTGKQCKNLKAYSCSTCRFHGARKKQNIRSGVDHPLYVHGNRTKETIAKQRVVNNTLRSLEQALVVTGVMERRLLTKASLPSDCPEIKNLQQVENLIFTLENLSNPRLVIPN